MAKKAAEAGANKTELTKQYVAKHPTAGLKEIVDGLKQQGVDISRSLASKIKYAGAIARKTLAGSTQISIDDLIAAKKLVEQLGGVEHVKTAIAALAKLS